MIDRSTIVHVICNKRGRSIGRTSLVSVNVMETQSPLEEKDSFSPVPYVFVETFGLRSGKYQGYSSIIVF